LIESIISSAVALVSALVGAVVGGRTAREGALAAAMKQARIADARSRASLSERLVHMLEGTQTIGLSLPGASERYSNALPVMRELFGLWEPFDSMGADLYLLQDAPLQQQLFIFCIKVRMLTRGYIESEARFDAVNRDADSGNERTMLRLRGEVHAARMIRRRVRTEGPPLASEAADLVRRLRAPHPLA